MSSVVIASYPKGRGIDSGHRQFFLFFKNYLKNISKILIYVDFSLEIHVEINLKIHLDF